MTDSNNVLGTMTKTVGSTTGAEGNSQPIPYTIDLSAGENDLTGDFGYTGSGQTTDPGKNGIIGDTVWFDVDGSGGATQTTG